MADTGQKYSELEDRLNAYIAWVKELSSGKIPNPPPTDAADPLARLGHELTHLSDMITRRESEFSRLFQVVHKVGRGLLVEDVLNGIFEGFSEILPYDRIGCAFLADGGVRLTAHWARSNLGPSQLAKGYSRQLAGSSLQQVFRTGEPRILNDLESYLSANPESDSTRRFVAEGGRASLTCPLFVDGHPLGILFFTSREKDAYRDIHQTAFRQIAEAVATVIAKSRLFQDLIESNQFLIRQAEHLKIAANRDALTGVLNRGAIMVVLEQQSRAAGVLGKPLGVIMADIDHFKRINDTYGHGAGDMALREFARRLSGELRPNDFLGRYGGEEFLLLIGDTSREKLLLIANRLRLAIAADAFHFATAAETITASFGVTLASDSIIPDEVLVDAADRALYAAKVGGRNRCEAA